MRSQSVTSSHYILCWTVEKRSQLGSVACYAEMPDSVLSCRRHRGSRDRHRTSPFRRERRILTAQCFLASAQASFVQFNYQKFRELSNAKSSGETSRRQCQNEMFGRVISDS